MSGKNTITMAKKETEKVTFENTEQVQEEKKPTKLVFNRGYNKIELTHNGELFVFPVNKCMEVPAEMNIPTNLGLDVR